MSRFYFELTNLTNDETIDFLNTVKSEDIEFAMKFKQINLEDIGIQVREESDDEPTL